MHNLLKSYTQLRLILLLLLPSILSCYGQNIVTLNDNKDNYPLSSSLEILIDSLGSLTFEDILSEKTQERFRKIPGEMNNLGYREETIWLKFSVKNYSNKTQWLLNFNYGTIDEVYFYKLNRGKTYSISKAGLKFPMNVREFIHRHIVYPLEIENGKQEIYYIKIRSGKSIPINLEIVHEELFFKNETIKILVLGIFYGGIILMAIYNIFLFFSIKDISYLLYSFYAISIGYYQSAVDGLGYVVYSPNEPIFNLYLGVINVWLLYIFGTLFSRDFLQIKDYSKYLSWILIGFALLNVSLIILTVSGNIYRTNITATIGFIYISLLLASGIYSLMKGNKNAKYFLIATMFLIIGMFSRAIKNIGLIEATLLTDYGLPYGMLIEMAIFSFALGNRINELKKNEEKEKALIRSRIASDLHDDIGSNLSSISVSSQMISKSKNLSESEKSLLEDITLTAKETASSIRDIVWFINPENDNSGNLLMRMKDTASKLLQGKEYTFNTNGCEQIKQRDLRFRRNLYLIYKEILNNIVKHSEAKRVVICISENGSKILLEVEDDGIGFTNDKTTQMGEGLKNIKKRAKELNGIAEVKSDNSGGTKWKIMI